MGSTCKNTDILPLDIFFCGGTIKYIDIEWKRFSCTYVLELSDITSIEIL